MLIQSEFLARQRERDDLMKRKRLLERKATDRRLATGKRMQTGGDRPLDNRRIIPRQRVEVVISKKPDRR